MSEQAGRVASRNDAANKLIATLRDAAVGIADLGDKLADAQRDSMAEEERLWALHEDLSEAEGAQETLSEWRQVLEDYRRGIRDRDELLERTVGL